ncbi:MAG: [protein-PII] uridylyltransferase [Thermodesulfobacteriota bacterium]
MPEQKETMNFQDASKRLLENREALVASFLKEKSPHFLEQNARLLDDYFRDSFEKSMIGPDLGINKNPYAIIALGRYGRQEQCLHSDVDILFLFKKDLPKEAEALIREMIYPLWDIGLDIGHATRSLKECVSLAGKDFEVLTSVLDARFICGMSPLYSELMRQLREKIIFRRSHKIVDWLVTANQERHRHFGDSAYLLEPNLKEGQGGLRDYHTMLWLSQLKFNLRRPRDLEYHGYLSHEEYMDLRRALDFIWNIRSGLHLLTGRKYDQLHFDHQVRLAEMFDYQGPDRQSAVEQFLCDLHGHMEVIKQCHQMFLYEVGKTKKWFRIKRKTAQKMPEVEGLEIRKDTLDFESPKAIMDYPPLLIRIFEESARLKLPLSPEARRLIREFTNLVDDPFRCDPETVASFERILILKSLDAFNVLNEMSNTGFLSRLIPEMEAVVNRIEYDSYHVFPVDKHLLRTVRILKRFGGDEDPTRDELCGELYAELPDKRLLLWAGLLHDIGKGDSDADHSETGAEIAARVLRRFGYSEADTDTVSFLVREHLLMLKTATRRDLEVEETAVCCARKVADPLRLKMLYLLTLGDLIATGPRAWNEWTATLLRDLFFKTLSVMEKGELANQDAAALAREKTADILEGDPSLQHGVDLEGLFHVMSPRYLLYVPTNEIQEHIRLYKDLGDRPFQWKITAAPESNTRTVAVCGKDMPGFFSKIAGVLALNRIHVLDAQVYTWRNNIALNLFTVTPPPDPIFEDERWDRAEQDLNNALSGKLDLTAEVDTQMSCNPFPGSPAWEFPNHINIDNTSSGFFTIIEIFTCDVPGLLFRLTDTLFKCRLDIWSAQVSTRVDQVVDVFYVRDFDGQKADSPEQVARIHEAIEAELPEASPYDQNDQKRKTAT